MAERKAVNKYYPPDWDPRKGSANKRVGQHPLRDRAKKLSQGILVIRFELPYNIWCGGCGSHVGMGVRYNAEKSKVGNYYSTPIYKFRMKCHLCDNYFEIQTDPKNHDYVILCGARRKEQRWDPVANEQVVPEDKNTQKKLATDAMFKLEHGSNDQQKGAEKTQSLAVLEESKISMKDDYILNRMARDRFRTEKKLMKESQDADNAILKRNSLDISLVEETEEDRKLATLMKYSVTTSYEEKQKERRKSIELRPLFNTQMSLAAVKGKELKLGKALEASYKSPFQSSKKKPTRSLSKHSLVVIKRRKAGKHLSKAVRKEMLREGLKIKSGLSGSTLTQDCVSKPGSSGSMLAKDCVSKPDSSGSILAQDCVSQTVQSTPSSSDTVSYSVHDSSEGQHSNSESDHRTACDSTHLTQPHSHINDESCVAPDVETGEMNLRFNAKSGLFSLMSSYADSDSDSALSVT